MARLRRAYQSDACQTTADCTPAYHSPGFTALSGPQQTADQSLAASAPRICAARAAGTSWRAIQHFYRKKVERLQEALNQPEIRDEAIEVLRSLLERVVIAPVEEGFDIEIIGEIAQMIEVSMGEGGKKGPILNQSMGRSVKVVAGARNQRCLHLDHAIL